MAHDAFGKEWRALAGIWRRQDTGVLTGRNSDATRRAEVAHFVDLGHAYYAMDEPTAKQTARYAYAERRVKLGREDAESYKTFAKSRGEW